MQLDMLALLDELEPRTRTPAERDADVLAHYLAPWQLADAVRALTTAKAPGAWAQVRSKLVSGHQGHYGAGRDWRTESDGVHVLRWPDVAPWVLSWSRVAEVLREAAHRAGPDACEALLTACSVAHDHRIASPRLPFVPHCEATDETRAAEERWWLEQGLPHSERQRALDAAARAAARVVLPGDAS